MSSPETTAFRISTLTRRSVLRYGVLALAVLAMAWPSSEPAKAPVRLSGSEWRVLEIAGHEATGAGTLRFTVASIRGKSACNSFMGAFREIGGSIEIAGIGVTRMFCEDHKDIQQALFDALGQARTYMVDGATLTLLDEAGRTLVKLAE